MMITVNASNHLGGTVQLREIKIRHSAIEEIEFLGLHPCWAKGAMFDGPICKVTMISGSIHYINATVEELEKRSA